MKKKNSPLGFWLGVVACVLSLLSIYFNLYFLIVGIAAIVVSNIALNISKKNGDTNLFGFIGFSVSIASTGVWFVLWLYTLVVYGQLIF